MRRRKTRIENSFLKVDSACAKKVKSCYGMKEKGLIKLAERTIVIGIGEDDSAITENIEEYFRRLRIAYSNIYRYYLCAQYALVFQSNVLIDLIPIYGSTRNETEQEYKKRKFTFEEMEVHQQMEIKDLSIRSFKVDAGLERGIWHAEYYDQESFEDL